MAEKKRLLFTEANVRTIAPPHAGCAWIYDEKQPGLALQITAKGAKTFYFYAWNPTTEKPCKMVLGRYPKLSVIQARDGAKKEAGKIARGEDPVADRHGRRQEKTLAELWTSYLDLWAKPRKRSWKDDERMYNKYMGDFHGKRLSAITQTVVAKWHGAIATDHGPIQANRVKALLATMFSKSAATVGYTGPNPCIGVANFPEKSRERFLLPAEMDAFFRALAGEDVYWQAFFLLCLFTGSRRGNIASMEWAEIDLTNGVWHIPASKTKNKKPASIALCSPALAILNTRYDQRDGSGWVFPSVQGDGHLVDPRKAWNRVLVSMRACPKCREIVGQGKLVDEKAWRRKDRKYICPKCNAKLPEAKMPDLVMHDLRRTQGSWQAAMGISLAIIGKSLGHADLKSTQVYSRLQLDSVRGAVAGASASMIDAGHVTIDGAGVRLITAE